MLDKDTEPFSNPLAPSNQEVQKVVQSSSQETDQNAQPLTNDDFRKLMMTPRPMSSALGLMSVRSEYPASVRGSVGSRKPILKQEINENKKKKKKFYAAIKKQDEDTLAELAAKYRDRAKERRDGHNPDYQNEDPMSGIAAYRAVAPDVKSVVDAAVRRKQMIEESKFLGGDMAHTHLVKGLDYALLQKVKAENQDDDDEDEEEMEELEQIKDKSKAPDMKEENEEDIWLPKSILAKNIINTLTKAKLPEKQELFLPGRMAYIVDLEDECADDIPTTVIRSKADCPNWDSITTLSTNDIVINKLTQILSYLRYGGGHKKKKKEKIPFIEDTIKEKSKEKKKEDLSDSIYGDIGDYVPSFGKEKNKRDEMKDKERRSRGYFEKPSYSDDIPSTSKNRLIKEEKDKNHKPLLEDVQLKAKLSSKLDNNAPESYAECYPGAPENDDAILDSDDEVDYSKMDLGNKKGTIGRWDFDTAEEYGEYMSNKEALPKAAFQYGVKMADGRRTRRIQGKKDEKTKLDRDLQKINALIAKRKADSSDSGAPIHFRTPLETEYKRHKH